MPPARKSFLTLDIVCHLERLGTVKIIKSRFLFVEQLFPHFIFPSLIDELDILASGFMETGAKPKVEMI